METLHFKQERQTRENLIRKYIGYGEEHARFVVDKGHRNGPEIHIITTTALIVVLNQRTKKHVTTLIARPGQIRRYYEENQTPYFLVKQALDHQRKGWNEW